MTADTTAPPKAPNAPNARQLPRHKARRLFLFPFRRPRDPGAQVRSVIGISEEILAKTPTWRPFYTMLALIVLNAGLLASLSMLAMLVKFADAPWPVLVPVALGWGWIVVSIDRWLITGMQGSARVRVGALVIRLLLALFIGVVVAEPLLLKIFESSIHREVRAGRIDRRLELESALLACNPVPYRPLPPADLNRCKAEGRRLSVSGTVATAFDALQRTQARQAELTRQINAAEKRIADAEKTARRECVGARGPEFTGQAGDGPFCAGARRSVERARTDSDVPGLQREARALARVLPVRVTATQSAGRRYEQQSHAAIEAKLPPVSGRIDLLDEGMALERMSWHSGFAFVAQWFLRILLILLDCVPVLAKKVSGITSYDEMLTARRVKDEAVHASDEELDRQRRLSGNRVALRRSELDERRRLDLLEQEEHTAQRQADADLDARIDALADELRRRPRPDA